MTAKRPFFLLIVLLMLLASAALSLPVFAQASLLGLQEEYKTLYRTAKDSVVVVSHQPLSQINTGNPLQAGAIATQFGTGWVYDGQYIVTSAENAFGPAARAAQTRDWEKALKELRMYYAITADGETLECIVEGFDMASLTLVLKLPKSAKLRGLPLAAEAPVIGTTVAALGNSFNSMLADGEVSMSVGSLSDAYRMEPVGLTNTTDEPGDAYRGTMLEFEGAGNPGDYGGPLLDMKGRVIGMLCGHYHSGRRVACAVPAVHIRAALETIIGKKAPEPNLLGLYLSKQGRDDAPREGIVLHVTEGSHAERAGLQRGDEIVMIDGWRMSGFDQISNAFGSRYRAEGTGTSASVLSYGVPAGTSMLVTVRRDGALLTKEVIAGASSAMPKNLPGGTGGESADLVAIRNAGRASSHLVQVITDWNRSASTLPGGRSLGRLAAAAGQPDGVFLDTRIGPYTGVVIGADGEILVSDQILGDFIEGRPAGISSALRQVYVVLPGGETLPATVAGRNQGTGLALLKIDAKGLSPVTFTSDVPKPAELLTLVSRSNHHKLWSVRSGIVSATNRNAGDELQFDARVGSCDLGSLVLDSRGRAVGMMTNLSVTEVGKASGVAMATYGSKSLDKALESLRKGEFEKIPPQPFLGVAASPAYADQPGLKVGNVTPGSAAAVAGIVEGDVIVEVEGVAMNRTTDLVAQIRGKKVGDKLKLKIDRNGEELNVEAVLGARGRN